MPPKRTAWCSRAVLLGVTWLWPLAPWAATYYVSTAGNDGNSGTTLDAPFRTIGHAVNGAAAGDTVVVRGGTYREDVEMNTGGTADRPLVLTAYPGEVPVIKGSNVVTGWVKYNATIWMKQSWP